MSEPDMTSSSSSSSSSHRSSSSNKKIGLHFLDNFCTNSLLFLFFTVILITNGALMSIIIFIYWNGTVVQDTVRDVILEHEGSSLNFTRTVPLENQVILNDILDELQQRHGQGQGQGQGAGRHNNNNT